MKKQVIDLLNAGKINEASSLLSAIEVSLNLLQSGLSKKGVEVPEPTTAVAGKAWQSFKSFTIDYRKIILVAGPIVALVIVALFVRRIIPHGTGALERDIKKVQTDAENVERRKKELLRKLEQMKQRLKK